MGSAIKSTDVASFALLTGLLGTAWAGRTTAGNSTGIHKHNFTQTLMSGTFPCLIGKAAIAAADAMEGKTTSLGLYSSCAKNTILQKQHNLNE